MDNNKPEPTVPPVIKLPIFISVMAESTIYMNGREKDMKLLATTYIPQEEIAETITMISARLLRSLEDAHQFSESDHDA